MTVGSRLYYMYGHSAHVHLSIIEFSLSLNRIARSAILFADVVQ